MCKSTQNIPHDRTFLFRQNTPCHIIQRDSILPSHNYVIFFATPHKRGSQNSPKKRGVSHFLSPPATPNISLPCGQRSRRSCGFLLNTNRTDDTNILLALRAEIYKSYKLCASRNKPIPAAGGIIYEIYKISQAVGDAGESNLLALAGRNLVDLVNLCASRKSPPEAE